MTDEQTPDEWLLADFDRRNDLPYRHASITHHVREMFQLIDDLPHNGRGEPTLSGAAKWPDPYLHHDLGALDEAARNLAALQSARESGAVA